jgi:ABC-2 type transport system permease protein
VRFLVVVIVAGLVVGARLWMRSRRRSGIEAPRARRWRPSFLESKTGLVAVREVKERARARSFRVVTAVVLITVAAAIVIPVLTRGKSHAQQVGVVGTLSAAQRAAVEEAARSVGTKVDFVAESGGESTDSALRAGRIEVALIDGRQVAVNEPINSDDTSTTARFVRAVAAELGLDEAFSSANLSPAQVARIRGAKPLRVSSLQTASSKAAAVKGTSIVGVIIVFIMLSQYETWTLIGVMEEKSSRVVEVLLATVRPIQLLGGKVLGIGVVALAQATLILAFSLVLAKAVGSDLLHGSAPLMLAAALLWLVIGYAFYSWIYAAAGSLAERQDQVQTLALPLSLPMIVGYVLALTAASTGHASVFVEVLGYLPPTAPFVMPVLVGLGAVTWWGFAASVVISIACTVVVARLAALVYRRAVLRTGRRVRLREVLAGFSP